MNQATLARPLGIPLWIAALVTAPAVAGSILGLVLLSRLPSFAGRSKKIRHEHPVVPAGQKPLWSLRSTIVGQTLPVINQMFGPPPAAKEDNQSITWYYPLHAVEKLAMAIHFHEGRVNTVEFFHLNDGTVFNSDTGSEKGI